WTPSRQRSRGKIRSRLRIRRDGGRKEDRTLRGVSRRRRALRRLCAVPDREQDRRREDQEGDAEEISRGGRPLRHSPLPVSESGGSSRNSLCRRSSRARASAALSGGTRTRLTPNAPMFSGQGEPPEGPSTSHGISSDLSNPAIRDASSSCPVEATSTHSGSTFFGIHFSHQSFVINNW